MNRKWYAVYTKPQTEKKVIGLLARRKVEVFCPMNKIETGNANRRKSGQIPLFPSIIFVFLSEQEMKEVREIPEVLNFMYWLGRPAIINTQEIQNIAHFTETHCNIRVEKTAVNKTALIRISQQPSLNLDDDTISVKNTHIRLTLPSLGYVISASTHEPVSREIRFTRHNNEILN